MTEEEPLRPNGLPTGAIAPFIDTKDIDGNPVNLKNLLENYKGVLIDFFRGNW
jgi:hypothetical protein